MSAKLDNPHASLEHNGQLTPEDILLEIFAAAVSRKLINLPAQINTATVSAALEVAADRATAVNLVVRQKSDGSPVFTVSADEVLSRVLGSALARTPFELSPDVAASSLRAALATVDTTTASISNEVGPKPISIDENTGLASTAIGPLPNIPSKLTIATSRKPKKRHQGIMAIAMVICFGGLWGLSNFNPIPKAKIAKTPISGLYTKAANDKTAFLALQERARAGDAEAAFDLGMLSDTSLRRAETVAPKDDAAAFKWYNMSAMAGYSSAEEKVAKSYQAGRGVTADMQQAASWYQKAAANGVAVAQARLGDLYQSGIGLPKDDHLAFHWFQLAALQGVSMAQTNLGAAYETGTGTEQDFQLASKWLRKAALQGDPNAQNRLGYLYFVGLGVPQNFALAVGLFNKAASQGLAAAEVNLGLCYARGAGVPQDKLRAAAWFMLASAQGDQEGDTALNTLSPGLTPDQLTAAASTASALKAAAQE